MSAKAVSIKGARSVFGDFPLLLGKYPDRPAPVHVVNGFLAAALGNGTAARAIRAMLDEDNPLPAPPISPAIITDISRRERLRDSLKVALNPDRRAWGERFASLVPLDRAFVARDPSDEGLGKAIWGLLAGNAKQVLPQMNLLLRPRQPTDALAILSRLLADGLATEETKASGDGDVAAPWPTKPGTLGASLAGSLQRLITSSIAPNNSITRSARLSSLSAATYFAAWLGALRTPSIVFGGAKQWRDVKPMFFVGGIPPGDRTDVAVRLAARSFEAVVAEHRALLQESLAARLAKVKLPAALPKTQHGSTMLKQALPSLTDQQLEAALATIKSSMKPDNIAERLINEIYPAGTLESGFRSMGRKLGIAGPDRGYGSPRFLLETPILGLLVDATLDPGQHLPYDEWLDRLYETFGFVLGIGRSHDGRELLSGLEEPGPLFTALESNHDELRRRLIRSGLASEYSDAETEVHRHEEKR